MRTAIVAILLAFAAPAFADDKLDEAIKSADTFCGPVPPPVTGMLFPSEVQERAAVRECRMKIVERSVGDPK